MRTIEDFNRPRDRALNTIMKTLFTAEAISNGGRSETIQTPDRLLNVTLGRVILCVALMGCVGHVDRGYGATVVVPAPSIPVPVPNVGVTVPNVGVTVPNVGVAVPVIPVIPVPMPGVITQV